MNANRLLTTAVAVLSVALLMNACGGGAKAKTNYPPAGEDVFENTTATVHIELTQEGVSAGPLLQEMETVELEGPARITRSDPEKDGDLYVVRTEIVEMELAGTASFGQVIVRESADKQSLGEVRQQKKGKDAPADSFFDIFFEVEVPDLGMTLHNEEAMHMAAELHALPPAENDAYMGEDERQLYTPAGLQVGRVVDARHIPNPPPPPSGTEEPTEPSTAEPTAETPTPPTGGEEVEARQTPGCEHTQPGVESEVRDVVVTVNADDGTPIEGATVTGSAFGAGVIGETTATGVTDAQGQAHLRWRINKLGAYTLRIDSVVDAEGNDLTLTTTSQVEANFTVTAECVSPPGF